ncbi:MAG: DUF4407 domain-containing protein [Lunatimonas sp.]|uniref:DUF4407 domain-containing protein n=1 Tax=Lunatimonas sp. TaxID=2060141 RepID=UPI00263AA75E|nr:DUF4407 domain-containing protein [Lunatimonas sp.]MCC5937508.1 DUF4407 domain-containing protein [Lunatimonas sp.]
MTVFMKIFCKLFGYDYQLAISQPTISRQRIMILGTLILIPVGLWAFSGYYLTYYLLGTSHVLSLAIAAALGLVIFFVDRSFVATPKTEKGFGLTTLRVGFALVATVLGSLAIDLALFEGDLEEYRQAKGTGEAKVYADGYIKEKEVEIQKLELALSEAERYYRERALAFEKEIDGKGGTGQRGFGKVASAKEREKDQAAERVRAAEAALEQYKQAIKDDAEAYAAGMAGKRSDALLSKIKDLHEFVFSDGLVMAVYAFFFGFVFLLEVYFMAYKASVGESLFEEFLRAEEEYGRQRLDTYRLQKQKILRDRQLLGSDYERYKYLL